jgi:hypothetical protein
MDLNEEFTRTVQQGLVPQVADSYVAVAIMPESPDEVDVKFAVELGVMIMLDKPILAVVRPGTRVPDKLKLVAEVIVTADIATSEGQALLMQGIEDIKKVADDYALQDQHDEANKEAPE